MLYQTIKVAKTLAKSKLVNNFSYLLITQITNFLFPIVLTPLLLKRITIEHFGLVMYAQSVMLYFNTFVDYGFNLSATRSISINKESNSKCTQIFNSVIFTKILLLIFSFFILSTIILSFDFFRKNATIYFFSFFIVFGQAITPLWLFQGLERMKTMAILNAISKLTPLIAIIIFVVDDSKIMLINLFMGVGFCLSGIVSLLIIRYKYNIIFKTPNISEIAYQLKDSWAIFISNFSITISLSSNVILLGILSQNNTLVGYYNISEKIFYCLRTVAAVIYSSIYPRVCAIANISEDNLRYFMASLIKISLIFFAPACFILFYFSPQIIEIFAGKRIPQSIMILKIFSFIPLITMLNIPPCQTMLALGFNKLYSYISLGNALLNIILNCILFKFLSVQGIAWSAFITELSITLTLYIFLHIFHKKYTMINIFSFKKSLNVQDFS